MSISSDFLLNHIFRAVAVAHLAVATKKWKWNVKCTWMKHEKRNLAISKHVQNQSWQWKLGKVRSSKCQSVGSICWCQCQSNIYIAPKVESEALACGWLGVIGRREKVRFKAGLKKSGKTVRWADVQRERIPIIRRMYTKSSRGKRLFSTGRNHKKVTIISRPSWLQWYSSNVNPTEHRSLSHSQARDTREWISRRQIKATERQHRSYEHWRLRLTSRTRYFILQTETACKYSDVSTLDADGERHIQKFVLGGIKLGGGIK